MVVDWLGIIWHDCMIFLANVISYTFGRWEAHPSLKAAWHSMTSWFFLLQCICLLASHLREETGKINITIPQNIPSHGRLIYSPPKKLTARPSKVGKRSLSLKSLKNFPVKGLWFLWFMFGGGVMVMDHQQPQVIHIASMAPQRSIQVSPFPKNLSRSTDEANAIGQRPANVETNRASPTNNKGESFIGNLGNCHGLPVFGQCYLFVMRVVWNKNLGFERWWDKKISRYKEQYPYRAYTCTCTLLSNKPC